MSGGLGARIRRIDWVRSWSFVFLLLLLNSGCFKNSSKLPLSPGAGGPLQIAAASDLQAALPALIQNFNQQSPTFEVVLTFGASGQLAEQVKAGAPFDILMAANEAYIKDLALEHYIQAESAEPYAIGSLALAVNPEKKALVTTLADLAKPEVTKIAIANPEFAPYGVAAKAALERAGLWQAIEPKIVRAETVRQALQFVESGNAEAALVGKALLKLAKVETVEVDPKLYDPIVQSLGIVERSDNKTAANIFLRYLHTKAATDILKEYGFQIPQPVSGKMIPKS